MRVALAFPGCHRRGGVERIVLECARYLAHRGHTVELLASAWEEIGAGNVNYHRVPAWPVPWFARGAAYYYHSSRMLRGIPHDVLNTHGCICPTGGVQWVQSIQRAWLETSRRTRPAFSLGRLRQRLNPLHPVLLYLEEKHFRERRYRKVITTTPAVRADLGRLYQVPAEDVVVIPNGFQPREFNPERRAELRGEVRAGLGLNPEHVVLLFVANELPRKGYQTLLRAMKIAQAPELRLLVIGRPSREAVLRQAAEHGLEKQVLAGGLSGEVARAHAAADLFVLPTEYEAFCLAILEALGSGLPVITTRVPGAQDAIQPGINGELIDAGDAEALAAHLQTFRDAGRRREYSERTPATAARYQWPNVLQEYEKVLLEHAGGPRS